MIEQIENTIITELKKHFWQSEVDSFPVDFEKYNFLSYHSCILVRFEGSDISNQNTIVSVNANETYNFTIFAAKRYAKKYSDCYPFLKCIKAKLNGLSVLSKRLILSQIKFEDEISGDLWYSFSTKVTLPIVDEHKDLSAANNVIALKKIKGI